MFLPARFCLPTTPAYATMASPHLLRTRRNLRP
ncbi:hypothetical protein L914_15954 [Phytophthora nicotianae]|uniref:Uncharacterized protein n=1 Tax=Phytophthora nicotianae TaxID=4792 RepID=W2MMB1_PHYNI|nr:hypothetical protein L914_15954 [Phytophthora nicotianae]